MISPDRAVLWLKHANLLHKLVHTRNLTAKEKENIKAELEEVRKQLHEGGKRDAHRARSN